MRRHLINSVRSSTTERQRAAPAALDLLDRPGETDRSELRFERSPDLAQATDPAAEILIA
jgi:hypothetical protein